MNIDDNKRVVTAAVISAVLLFLPLVLQPAVSMDASAFTTRLTYVLLTVSFILMAVIARDRPYAPSVPLSIPIVLGILFCVLIVMSLLLSEAQDVQYIRLYEYATCLLIAFLLYSRYSSGQRDTFFLGVSIAFAIAGVLSHLFLAVTVDLGTWVWATNPYPFNNIRISGFAGYFGFCSAVVFLFLARGYVRFGLALSIYFVLATWLFWMGGRGSILPAILFLIGITAWSVCFRYAHDRVIAVWSVAYLALLLANYFALQEALGFSWEQMKLTDNAAGFTSLRSTIWITTLLEWWGDARYFGWGPDGYYLSASRFNGFRHTAQPHSALVQLLTDFGLLVVIPMILFIGRAWLIQAARIRVLSLSRFGIFWMFSSAVPMALVDGVLYYYHSTILFVWLALLALWPSYEGKAVGSPVIARLAMLGLMILMAAFLAVLPGYLYWQLFT